MRILPRAGRRGNDSDNPGCESCGLSGSRSAPVHVRRHGCAHRHPGRRRRSPRCRSISFLTSTSRSSASSGSTTAFRPRRWRAASSRISSAALTSNVNDIEHIESQSHQSVAVVRIYFHPERASRSGARADRDAVSGRGPQHAARNVSAAHPEVRRGERADPAARPEQQDAQGAGDLRSGEQLHSNAAGDRAGRHRLLPVRRQEPPDHGGPRPRRAVREAAVAD